MNSFDPGDRVRIIFSEREVGKTYVIKNIKKVRKGGFLYLLKSLDENIFRLYYEDKESLLEKIS
jgi:hypothetical protein